MLVVYGHVLRGLDSAGMGFPEGFFAVSNKLVYGFHMPLFFLLSGIFAEQWMKKGLAKGTKEKVITILFPYFVWTLIQGSINVVLSNVTNNPISWGELFTKIWYQPLWQFWFLYVLFLFFPVFYLLRKVVSLKIMLIISAVLYISMPYVDFWISKYFMINFLFFVLGTQVMNFNLEKVEETVYKANYRVLTACSFIIFNCFYLSALPLFNNSIYNLVIALVGINLIVTTSVFISKRNYLGIIDYVGKASMAIYLTHILATSGLRIILSKFLGVDNAWLHLILGTVFGVVLPIVAFLIAEKFKIGNILFGGKNKSNPLKSGIAS